MTLTYVGRFMLAAQDYPNVTAKDFLRACRLPVILHQAISQQLSIFPYPISLAPAGLRILLYVAPLLLVPRKDKSFPTRHTWQHVPDYLPHILSTFRIGIPTCFRCLMQPRRYLYWRKPRKDFRCFRGQREVV